MEGKAVVRKREGDAGKRKRKRGGGAKGGEAALDKAAVAAVVGKVAECVQEEVEDYEGITEESITEVMGWLELEIKLAAPPPAASPVAGYVTVKGGMESCGPSFSGSASTVMASVDVRTGAPAPPAMPRPRPDAAAAALGEQEAADDEWVAQLLTDGPGAEGP